MVRSSALAGLLLLVAAPPLPAPPTVDDLKKDAGTVVLMVGSQTPGGSTAALPVEGVYRFRRSVTGDDGSYYTVRLGVQGDPFSTSAADRTMTPAFPVATGKSVGIDKFKRVYLQDVDRDTTVHDVATEAAAAHPSGSTKSWSEGVEYHVTEGSGADFQATPVGTYSISQNFELKGLAQVAPDGQITYPGTAAWTEVTVPSERGFQMGFANFTGGGFYTQSFRKWTFNRLAGATYVPPDQGTLSPVTLTLYHPQSAFGKGWTGPIPAGNAIVDTSGNPQGPGVPTPLDVGYITDIAANYATDYRGLGTRAGYEFRRWVSATFSRDIYKLFEYADNETAAQVAVSVGKCQAGDPVYSSVSYNANYDRTNNCADFCITGGSSGSEAGQTAEAKAVFSSFGQSLSTQRMYVALKSGGTPSLVQFSLAATNPCGAGAAWTRSVINTTASPLVKRISSYLGPTTEANYETVGISSRDSSSEYFYLSRLPGNQFAISSNLFLQGGIIFQLEKSATPGGDDLVRWEERIESETVTDAPAQSVSGTINVGPDVVAISADGEGNLYYTRSEKDPPDARLPTDFYNGQSGPAIFTAANPYFVSLVANDVAPLYTHVATFRQFVGYRAYKTNRFNASPLPIGFARIGNNTFEGQWNQNPAYTPGVNNWNMPPGPGQIVPPAATVNNRAELAAVNVSFPPPIDAINTVDVLWRGLARTNPPQRPQADRSVSIAEDDPEHYFDVENPPEFGGLFRIDRGVTPARPIGYSNMAPTNDQDTDSSIGRYSSSVVWGDDVGDTTYDFQYRWEIANITFEGAPNHDPLKGVTVSLENPDGSAGPAIPANPAVGYTMAYVTPARSPSTPSGATNARVQIPLLKARFLNPGRYRARLYVQGYYWNMTLDPVLGLDGPISFNKEPFGERASATTPMFGEQIVNVAARVPPPTTDYVYDVQIRGNGVVPAASRGASSASLVRIDERDTGNPAKIYAEALVSFYQGDHYDSSTGQMAKATGVGVWNYNWDAAADTVDWPVVAGTNPPNFRAGSTGRPLLYDPVPRNDGDGNWGTRYFYGGADMDTADPTSQQAHDWYEIKYEWIGDYVDPRVVSAPGQVFDPAATPSQRMQRVLKRGNLSELVVLTAIGANTNMVGSTPFIQRATVANPPGMSFARVYWVRLPLLDPSGTNLTTNNNDFNGRPLAGGARTATPPTWQVPTEPVPVKVSCRFFYPRAKWVAHQDPARPPLRDTAGATLYYDLADDTSATFTLAAPGDPGSYLKGAGLAPRYVYSDPSAGDDDDYLELLVRDLTPAGLESSPASVGGLAGATATASVQLGFRDNNPYIHFADWRQVRPDISWPKLTYLFYEFGREASGGRDQAGVGLLPGSGYHGFDISAYPFPADSYPGEPTNPYKARPSAYRYTPSAMTSDPTTWTALKSYPQMGRPWPQTDIDLLTPGSLSTISDPLTWWTPTTSAANARRTTYTVPWSDIVLPLFHDASTYGALNLLVKVDDGVRTTPILGGAIGVDNRDSPPNVRVLLLNEKTQEPIYYTVENDWAWSGTAGAPTLTGSSPFISIVRKQGDPRTPFASQAGFFTIEVPPPTSSSMGGSFAGIATARVYDFGTIQSAQGRFYVEEDVRIAIKAWAVDNLTRDPSLYITRNGDAPLEELASRVLLEGSGASRMASLLARQSWPRAGATDTIIVTAGDGDTGLQIRIPVTVVKYTPDFKAVGSGVLQK